MCWSEGENLKGSLNCQFPIRSEDYWQLVPLRLGILPSGLFKIGNAFAKSSLYFFGKGIKTLVVFLYCS